VVPANTGRGGDRAGVDEGREPAAASPNGAAAHGQAEIGGEGPPERTPSGVALWGWWTVATIAGWALAGACVGAAFDQGSATPWQYVFVPLTGLFQWLLLRRHFARASWWLLATTAGAAVAGLIYAGLLALPEATFGPPTSGLRSGISDLTDGIALATAQWLVLRRTVRGAERWFPAVIAPLALFGWLDLQRGRAVADVVESVSRTGLIALAAANTALLGLLIGALTGAALMRLVETSAE
jgi:hypothetical protein